MPQSGETAVPAWVGAYIEAWRDRLLLYAWTIRVYLEKVPEEDPKTWAIVNLYPESLTAVITLSDEIPAEPDPEWQRVLIHELVHVRLAEVTEFVQQDVFPELGPGAQRMADAAFRRAVEPAVESLAIALHTTADVGAPTLNKEDGRS